MLLRRCTPLEKYAAGLDWKCGMQDRIPLLVEAIVIYWATFTVITLPMQGPALTN